MLADRTTLSPGSRNCLRHALGQPTSATEKTSMSSERVQRWDLLSLLLWWTCLYMEFYEELALRSSPAKPQLCKRYVDDTCCIVKKGTVEGLLDHLNSKTVHQVNCGGGEGWRPPLSQQPAPEEREWRPGCHRLQEPPTHWPIPVLSIAPSIPCQEGTGQGPVWQSKEHHHQAGQLAEGRVPPHQSPEAEQLPQCLHSLFMSAFCSWPGCRDHQDIATGGETHTPTGNAPLYRRGQWWHQTGLCRKFGMKVVFRSGRSLRSMLTKVKDALSMEKISKVVYRVPCSCSNAYVRKTVRRLVETWIKEHQDACQLGHWKSQHLQSMHGRAITQSSGRKPQWLTRPGPPRSCCWKFACKGLSGIKLKPSSLPKVVVHICVYRCT